MITIRHLAGIILVSTLTLGAVEVDWQSLPPLPAAPGESEALGVAGPFVGTHNGALIVAGGANFPDGLPWNPKADGTTPPKIYHDRIYVLPPKADAWQIAETKLPVTVGYGAAVSTANGVVCAGGHWKTLESDGSQELKLSDQVFAIRWTGDAIEIDANYPALPSGWTDMACGLVDDEFILVGGDAGDGPTTRCLSLNLADPQGWVERAPLPGRPRVLPVGAVQTVGKSKQLFVFSGRDTTVRGPEVLLHDAWRFDPAANSWHQLADVTVDGAPRCIMGGVALPSGNSHLAVLGGAAGDGFVKLAYEWPDAIAAAEANGDAAAVAELNAKKLQLLNNHPGFSPDLLLYHVITDTWVKIGETPNVPTVTTGAVNWNGQMVVPTGERSPGIRTPAVTAFQLSPKRSFGTLNYAVLILYLCAILINGAYFSRKMKSTDDFFKAGGRIPWWAAGLSIFGTQLSAITFIAIPAKVYASDWRLYIGQLGIIMVAPFVILWFLPFYRRLNVTTAYEYLEKRFNVFVRCFGSVMFIFLQFARIGIVLYLPAVALSIVTGISVDVCIIAMGALCIIYTVMGGMEAVIWTDVTQVVILLGGAILCLLIIPTQVGGWNAMVETGLAEGKYWLLDFRWDLAEPAFLVILLGSVCSNFISYGTDQAVIQRYLTTKDETAAARGIWTNAMLALPASMLFFLIGTALFVFFKAHPGELDPTLTNNEALFPLYIVNELPQGVAGLLIAAVFAASMSSLDSAMNSVSAAVTTDFYRRFNNAVTEAACLKLARFATIAIGVLGTAFAVAMAHTEIESIWDQFAFFLGLFGGGLGGVFILGIFTRRTHGLGAAIGLVGSGAAQFCLMQFSDMNKWFFAFTGLGACIVIGYLASLIIPRPKKDTDGLTIYTLKPAK